MEVYIGLDVHAHSAHSTTAAMVGPTGKRLRQEVISRTSTASGKRTAKKRR